MLKQLIVSPQYNKSRTTTYGGDCSDFMLSTYTKDEGTITLQGVLSEMPTFSMTPKYEEGPGEAISEQLSKFMCNDIMTVANAIGPVDTSNGAKNIIATGAVTRRMYAGVDYNSIDLKFRVFYNYNHGMLSFDSWAKTLSKYATPDTANGPTFANFANNIKAAAKNMYSAGKEVMGNLNFNDVEDGDTQLKKRKAKAKEFEQNAVKLDNALSLLNSAIAEKYPKARRFRLVVNGANAHVKRMKDYTNKTVFIPDDNGITTDTEFLLQISERGGQDPNQYHGGWDVLEQDGTTDCDATSDDGRVWYVNEACYSLDKDESKMFVDNFSMYFKSETDNCIVKCMNKNPDYFGDNVTDKDLDDWYTNEMKKTVQQSKLKAAMEEIIMKIGGEKPDDRTIRDRLRDSKVIEALNKVGEVAVARYNPGRVQHAFNKENMLGIRLWNLRIFTWIFASSLPVYIKSWSYKPSEEYKDNMPLYYDFSISCMLDQVISRDLWYKYYFGPPGTI